MAAGDDVWFRRADCPFDKAARAVVVGPVSTRDVAAAMNCALMSHCPSRRKCIDKVFVLLDHLDGRDLSRAAE